MKALLQRVSKAQVEVDQTVIGSIGAGLLLFLGIHTQDDTSCVDYLVDKVVNLRIFSDKDGKMNLSLLDVKGSVLLVSQFTLYGDCQTGRRPSFTESAKSDVAKPLYEYFIKELRKKCLVETGEFGANMQVNLINDGPVTLILEK
ncbi:MAG: D-aminoacyl-tRNA deacylase [Chlamydiota bacterium]